MSGDLQRRRSGKVHWGWRTEGTHSSNGRDAVVCRISHFQLPLWKPATALYAYRTHNASLRVHKS
jgi:hypothetical protein